MSLQSHLQQNPVHADPDVDTDTDTNIDKHNLLPDEQQVKKSPESFLDLPPESFWIPKGSEQDWFDENATIQRKRSMKLGFFGKSNNQHSKSFSHRSFASLNNQNTISSSLIALPKSQKNEGNHKQNKVPIRLFRSRSEPDRRGVTNVSEPGSPKVSCTGRVKCKKNRRIRTGFWKKVRAILKIRSRAKSVANVEPAGSVSKKMK